MTPSATVLIRRATERDLPRLTILDAQCFSPAWSTDCWRDELARPTSELLVALRDADAAELLAFALFWRIGDELHLQRLATDPRARRLGLARGLLAQAIANARATDQRCLLLEAAAQNEAALALYRDLGCVVVGRRARYYANGDDALLLTLELRR